MAGLEAIGDEFREVIHDLTRLEINTIIKPNMTARKMPDPAHAALDIAQAYGWYVANAGVHVARYLQDPNGGRELALHTGDGSASPEFASEQVRVVPATFEALRWAASTLERRAPQSSLQHGIAKRIVRNCDHLKGLVLLMGETVAGKSRAELGKGISAELPSRELMKLRKIWEVGVEQVVAQTTVALDGDVVNAVTPSVVGGRNHGVLEVQRLGIETSLSYWSSLIDVALKVADRLRR